jgi:predicted secreted protein with PEFG-CTERM motif
VNNSISIILLVAIFIVSLQTNYALAQTTYSINIPTGAGSPDAPFFWQSEKDGSTNGEISINISDTVSWENADTVAHTVVSGSPTEGPDGKFDSGLIPLGGVFIHQFTEAGNYAYFCSVHPWMTGIVKVSEVSAALQTIPNVGAKVGDGKTTFNVEYEFSRMIASAAIDEKQKAITFEIVGKPKSSDNNLSLMLPKGLISGPLVVWVDGQQVADFKITPEGGINKVVIPMNEKSERLTIVGASVVPEFGTITMTVLAIGVFSLIAITKKTQKINIPKF